MDGRCITLTTQGVWGDMRVPYKHISALDKNEGFKMMQRTMRKTRFQIWERLERQATRSDIHQRRKSVFQALSLFRWSYIAYCSPIDFSQQPIVTENLSSILTPAQITSLEFALEKCSSTTMKATEHLEENLYIQIGVLKSVVSILRQSFVSLGTAKYIARSLSELPDIQTVGIYGSLARSENNPDDIDLLVIDNGKYSITDFIYPLLARSSLELSMSLPNKDLSRLVGAMFCGWLDIHIIDESMFDIRSLHTSRLIRLQKDRLFFSRIAEDILLFNKATTEWEVDEQLRSRLRQMKPAWASRR